MDANNKNPGLHFEFDIENDDPLIVTQIGLLYASLPSGSLMFQGAMGVIVYGNKDKAPGLYEGLHRSVREYTGVILFSEEKAEIVVARLNRSIAQYLIECLEAKK